MIALGRYNTLTTLRFTGPGAFLGDDKGNEVLLPHKYVPEGLMIGEEIEVFVYPDAERRPIATTLQPLLQVGEFAYLECVHLSEAGAFVDIGLEKDLFVPFKLQAERMALGRSYLVHMFLDDVTQRLVGSSRRNRFLEKEDMALEPGQEVELLICEASDIGVRVIINHRYAGMLFHNEIFRKLRMGERTKGFIKGIHDGIKVDVTLQRQGFENVEPSAQKILDLLNRHEGYLNMTDKSSPDEIRNRLQMSKKTFKKALGSLYKQRLIRIEADGVYLA